VLFSAVAVAKLKFCNSLIRYIPNYIIAIPNDREPGNWQPTTGNQHNYPFSIEPLSKVKK
jgi:hypothetical protein